ncbi:MAG: hypothetical protein ACXU89_29765, partial [Xanthobacteraceae bacterium]
LDRGEHDVASARVVWRGGAVTNLEVKMKVNSIAMLTRGMEMRDRALDLARDGMPDVQIATVLTGEGHRSPKGLSLDNRIGRKESRLGQRRNERICKWE